MIFNSISKNHINSILIKTKFLNNMLYENNPPQQ